MRKSKLFKLLLVAIVLFSLLSCKSKEKPLTLSDRSIIYDDEFGGFFVDITIDDFNNLGFEFGDSLDLSFSSGDILTDIPYYNGYYCRQNETLVCGYPGYPYIKVAINSGPDLYEQLHFDGSEKATITLNTKAKYLDIQNTLNLVYKTDRESYESNEIFANYRNVVVGDIKEGILYRGCSPVDNQYNRAKTCNDLIEKDGIGFIVNLSDSEEEISEFIAQDDFKSFYVKDLLEKGNIVLLDMNADYRNLVFKQKLATGIRAMIKNDGPYFFHCLEGKDRTGFVMMVIEALCNASYEELLNDYITTYYNYYGININENNKEYNVIKNVIFDGLLDCIKCCEGETLQDKAKSYVLSSGLTNDEIDTLMTKLTK